jgi:bacteriorhodopsin
MKKIIALVLGFTPVFAFAQTQIGDINDVAKKATNVGNLIIGLAISLAVLWIIVSVVRYLIATNDPEKRAEGGKAIFYGVIGLFVILSIWGIVAILRNSFKTQDQVPINDINRTTTLPQPGYVQ